MQDPLELCDSLINAGLKAGFEAAQYGEAFGYPLLVLRRGKAGAPRVYLSAGIHGDEPAGPHALRALLVSGELPDGLDYTVCPLLNPAGFAAGVRENPNGIDLNRDFRKLQSLEARNLAHYLDSQEPFDFSACLHEDWEAEGFYLYRLGRDTEGWARQIVESLAPIGPIESAGQIDGRPASAGVISASPTDALLLQDEWPEAFYLYSKNEHPHFTFETPTSAPLELRVPMQLRAVSRSLELLAKISS